jgi:hypothetical protein
MVKLADTPALGAGPRKRVEVQVLFRPPKMVLDFLKLRWYNIHMSLEAFNDTESAGTFRFLARAALIAITLGIALAFLEPKEDIHVDDSSGIDYTQ